MILIRIENEYYTVSVNPLGAELSGIRAKDDGYEYLWQGDPAVWSGRSPLLFPIVGRLKQDCYIYQGKTYQLEKHGFAMGEMFEIAQQSDSSVSLRFSSPEKYAAVYPFRYDLTVTFALDGKSLIVSHRVTNRDTSPMYFSLGAHPGFHTHEGAYLEFPLPETVMAQRFDDDKIIRPERTPFLNGERIFHLQKHTFDDDAYVLEGLRSPYVRVVDPAAGRSVRVSFGKAPFLGIWAKPGAPYVCIEPWCGIDDDTKQSGVLKEKKGIVSLNGGENFDFSYVIEPMA